MQVATHCCGHDRGVGFEVVPVDFGDGPVNPASSLVRGGCLATVMHERVEPEQWGGQ